ncbi:hypothetical protein SD70_06575 [Gordoniibacillus kamchatkensis]|uniref:Uncharacterized protein n=1 Tax=Gordoniibacillus kamchatkensis TaxID=1590651 RepID=A0ABR5ALX2_9BACL|nr:hypothetical protein [Paenibacillus sp. VKM B-2647]KIL41530.1 hypothetical protein SD70_06575 [Paenibacillus sp. VKM B-2647]
MSKIVAVITVDKEQIAGGAPIFIVRSREEQEQVAFALEKIMNANAHDLKNGLMVIIDHAASG